MSEEYKSGSIDIILGCMFSGKTTELITRCKKWNAISNNVLCINYTEDKRYGHDDHIYSHSLDKIKCINVLKLAEISTDTINSSCVILINEGQFFSDLLEYCKLWADKFKKHIIVSGLDGDYKREKFGQILDLIPLCDSVQKITAYCVKCKNKNPPIPALFTHRISEEQEQKVIGSSNYVALCRYHYLEENK